jgi:phenylalanyl-tRNA synthetase alpha chain
VSRKEIEGVRKSIEKDFSSDDTVSYSELRSKYLGKKGVVTELLRSIGTAPEKDRAELGKLINSLRKEVEERLERAKETESSRKLGESLTELSFDVTAPFGPNTPEAQRPRLISERGTLHPLTSVGEKAIRIFENMGFHTVEARRLDNDYNVFEALNIPQGHPARDMWDTFWTEDDLIPITHTSAMQNRILSSVKPPIREISVGKCFRNEATDASHEHTFYQLEGVYVGEGITLADLIGTLSSFINAFYGREVKYKIQPSYFPFVEPGLEFLIECMVCGQKGCPFCGYSKWVEVIPCGPIHPNVLREAGLKPETYTGFAWGLGFDRLVLLRNQVSDIRYLHSGDIRFLEQFA